eukprot:3870216-Amphidinium_carterae.1
MLGLFDGVLNSCDEQTQHDALHNDLSLDDASQMASNGHPYGHRERAEQAHTYQHAVPTQIIT